MNMFVFAYGSLLNPRSRQKTLPGERSVRKAVLCGYQRKINAPVNGYLYLNIVPRKTKSVEGKIISVTSLEIEILKLREPGYACVNVTEKLESDVCGIVYAFIAPDVSYRDLKIPRSYIETCLMGKSDSEREAWIQETIMENEIEEDMRNPIYKNVVQIK